MGRTDSASVSRGQQIPCIPLPIDNFIEEIQARLTCDTTLVIRASPGSGKTTRVPPALRQIFGERGMVIVLEPRRLAARMAANRIASELGESCGETVGYHIRFDKTFSSQTKILFMTEGMLLRYMVADPELKNVSCIVLDEFHERHLHTDVAFALIRRLQKNSRPDLGLVVMSATLDLEPLKAVLGTPSVIDVQLPPYSLTVRHQVEATQTETVEIFSRRLFERVGKAIQFASDALLAQGISPGHVLVFLPGAGEIERCAEMLKRSGFEETYEILALHGSLTANEQRQVFEVNRDSPNSNASSKIILATNIAESSLTIDGVNIVIDSGLAKVPSYSSWAGLPVLKLQRVSQASCIQRSGRAARQGPGIAVRLYSESDFRSRAIHEPPEINRLDLTQTVLELSCIAAIADPSDLKSVHQFSAELDWVDVPDLDRFRLAVDLLQFIGGLDDDAHVTATGREMARFPLHPRLGRIIIEGQRRGLLVEACTFAAQVSEQSQRSAAKRGAYLQSFQQIARIAGEASSEPVNLALPEGQIAKITPLILAGYADRVARFEGGKKWRLVDGRIVSSLNLSRDDLVEWLCLVEADVNPTDPGKIVARTWYPLAVDANYEVLRQVPSLWRRGVTTWWDDSGGGRVKSAERTSFGVLTLLENAASLNPSEAGVILRQELKRSWPGPFDTDTELKQWHNRILVCAAALGEQPIADLMGADFDFLLDVLVESKSSFAEVAQRSIGSCVEELLGYEAAERIHSICPISIKLPSGRSAPIHYLVGQPPWIEGKIQEFFGWRQLPAIAGGRLSLVVHLLGPNYRPIQVTADLSGFWSHHYPAIRRAMARDYPRHFWPEDPLTAEPKILSKQRLNVRRD